MTGEERNDRGQDGAEGADRKGFDWFTEGFDTADLKEANALLDDLREFPDQL